MFPAPIYSIEVCPNSIGLFDVILRLNYITIHSIGLLNEHVLTTEYLITTISLMGIIVTTARVIVPPEETLCEDPAQLLEQVLKHIHYMPDEWKINPGNMHIMKVSIISYNIPRVHLFFIIYCIFCSPKSIARLENRAHDFYSYLAQIRIF